MSELVERLPWRLAALGGLLVGAASLLAGIDLWSTLLRVGAAFAVFWILGWAARAALRGLDAPPRPGSDKLGTHMDEKTPDMTPSDLHSPNVHSPNVHSPDAAPKPPAPGRDG